MTLNYKDILCLSGWGQRFDSLESIFNPIFFGSSFNYLKLGSSEEFFYEFKKANINPKVLVGWSLGGQMAIRLIEKEIVKPKLLILLAPPFQMVKDSRIQVGMTKTTFDKFYEDFSNAPTQTLKQFAILTAMNDVNAKEIAKSLHISNQNFSQLKIWLKELEVFSCFDVDFSKMPNTLYFHGAGDMIVHAFQAEFFKERIKNIRLEIFKNCGHAPHLNNITKLRKIIFEEISLLQ